MGEGTGQRLGSLAELSPLCGGHSHPRRRASARKGVPCEVELAPSRPLRLQEGLGTLRMSSLPRIRSVSPELTPRREPLEIRRYCIPRQ
jgi:hypothetical protein